MTFKKTKYYLINNTVTQNVVQVQGKEITSVLGRLSASRLGCRFDMEDNLVVDKSYFIKEITKNEFFKLQEYAIRINSVKWRGRNTIKKVKWN